MNMPLRPCPVNLRLETTNNRESGESEHGYCTLQHHDGKNIQHCDKELIITHESHLTDGDIARFIEGRLDAADIKRIAEHLRTCKRCFEWYQDSAVCSWLFESGSPAFASTAELAEAGFGVTPEAHDTGTAREGRVRFSPKWRLAFRIAAVCVVVCAAALIWHRSVERNGEYSVSAADLAPIRAALETASRWGPCVLPGGERHLEEPGPVYRSGAVPLNDSLESSLERLYNIYRTGKASSDAAYYLVAGKYATGQVDIARDLASYARERYPGDPRIAVVEALIAYTDGDHGRSATLLRAILEKDPDAPVASLNLAIVLAAQGNLGEARTILESVRMRQAGTALSSRAQSILSDLENR